MLKRITSIYKNIFSYFRKDWRFLLIVILAIIECTVFCILKSEADIAQYLAYYETNRPQYDNMLSFIFFENLQATFPEIVSGFFPFFIGTFFVLYLIINSLVISFKYILTIVPVGTLIAGTLPHGIFEIPAILLSIMLSAIISKEVTLTLLSFITKKKFDNPKAVFIRHGIKETAVFIVESLVFVVIPLVFLGAFVETFITGRILENFI